MFKRDVNMLDGPIVTGLLKISLPIMIMNIVQSLFSIIDMAILKNFGSSTEYAVGAVGACATLISLITGLIIGVSAGANVVTARYIGRNDTEGVERAIGAAFFFALTGGAALLAVGVLFAEVFLSWTNCPEELMNQATLYFRLYFAGCPILVLYNFSAASFCSSGDSTRPMIFLTIGGIIKVLSTFVFVAAFDMSVAGVAFSTILSWGTSLSMALSALFRNKGVVRLRLSRIKPYKTELLEILRIGLPAGLHQALYSVANVIISIAVNGLGPDATTGKAIADTFDGILYYISTATSLAVMPYVSQNVGCGNIKRATQSVTRGMLITIALGATFGMLSAGFSWQLSSIMSDNPAVLEYSRQKMIIVSSTFFICGINSIISEALRGMGRPMVSTVSTLIFMCAIRFPWVYFVFPLYKNLTFLYLIWPIGWVLSIIMLACFYFPTVKQLYASTAKNATNSVIN